MSTDQSLLDFVVDLQSTQRSMESASIAMKLASEELDRRNERINELLCALEAIQEIAENNYDGPEDKALGGILIECQRALGQMP